MIMMMMMMMMMIIIIITRMTLIGGRVRKYRPLLTVDTGVIPKNVPG
jgi:hypothetical protein